MFHHGAGGSFEGSRIVVFGVTPIGDSSHRRAPGAAVHMSRACVVLRLRGKRLGLRGIRSGEEAEMFAREMRFHLKLNAARELRPVFENEILPLLRRQKGFVDVLVMLDPYRKEAVNILLWEEQMYAERFHREAYLEIVAILDRFTEEVPVMKDFEVEYATIPAFEQFAAAAVV